jgi:hypothetical protein
MKTPASLRIFLLAGGVGLGLFAAGPVSAQYACPYGYYYSPAWGCAAAFPYRPYAYYPGYNAFGYPGYNAFGGFFFDGFRGDRFHHEGFRGHEGFHGHEGFRRHEGSHGHEGHR